MKNEQFREILNHFDTSMLVTRTSEGMLRARPMFIAESKVESKVGSRDAAEILFISSLSAEAVDEILAEERAAVVMQGATRYLSISGRASVIKDAARVAELWRPLMYAWFESKDDPSLVIIRFVPEEAEYWDQAGMRGIKLAFKALKAAVTGDKLKPSDIEEDRGRVQF